VGTATRFHPDAERWEIRDKAQQCTPGEALPKDYMPGVIHPDDVKDELGEIDAEYSAGLCHGTCLLWVNGCLRCRNPSGLSKPYGKEAGPFH
jgi:hypothetical protein